MSTDLFDRYASLDPANSPQAAPDWASTAPVLLAAIDERTTQMQTQAQTQDAVVSASTPSKSRNGILIAAAVFAIVVIAGAVLAFVSVRGETQPAGPIPEDVVAQLIEASNARDAAALADLYDPEIVHTYNAFQVTGNTFDDTHRAGRVNVLELLEGYVWPNWGPRVTSYEVLEVDGGTVTTSENVIMFGGSYRHVVTYEVSDDGLILREEHVVQG
jgi:hypothetical protein